MARMLQCNIPANQEAFLKEFSMIRHLGFVAARRGEPTSANPYRTYLERIAWIGGYSEGRVSQAFGTMLTTCDTARKR